MESNNIKIGVDLRDFSKKNKSFFNELIKWLNQNKSKNYFVLYTNIDSDVNILNENIKLKKVDIPNLWIKEQSIFFKILKDDKLDILISFDESWPIFYNKKRIQIISSLEKILFPNMAYSSSFKKYKYLFLLKNSINKSFKVITFDDKTKKDLNEKLNIDENKITTINPFFIKPPVSTSKINIKQKLSLDSDYLVYDSWVWNNKNIYKTIEVIKEINKTRKIYLLFLWNDISNNTEVREKVLELWLKDLVKFESDNDISILWEYYKQSIGTIYPSLYSGFPFSLSNSLYFWSNIIAHESIENKSILWDKINYFSWLSKKDMIEKLTLMIDNPKQNIDYSEILENYSVKKFLTKILEII